MIKASNNRFSEEVNYMLNKMDHPLRREIDYLRAIILNADTQLEENIKWNAPNYTLNTRDLLTMKIVPAKKIQLIFHRGAKKIVLPPTPLINDTSGLLTWITNDRAVATFNSMEDIAAQKNNVSNLVKMWLLK